MGNRFLLITKLLAFGIFTYISYYAIMTMAYFAGWKETLIELPNILTFGQPVFTLSAVVWGFCLIILIIPFIKWKKKIKNIQK